MYGGSTIKGNYSNDGGGGIAVCEGGTFIMHGGIIENNSTIGSGGGVYIKDGSFTMKSGAVIRENTAEDGGGVFLAGGTFTMESGADISGNSAIRGGGGGVFVSSGASLIMNGGEIKNNTSAYGIGGGGVYNNGSILMKNGAEISGNSVAKEDKRSGGGISNVGGHVKMENGSVISGNSASSAGGGIYFNDGSFEMEEGAVISGNSAPNGGGICVNQGGITVKGTIKENTATEKAAAVGAVEGCSITLEGAIIEGNVTNVEVNEDNQYGGVVGILKGTLNIINSKIINNTMTGKGNVYFGGGITAVDSKVTISGSEISGNTVTGDSYGFHGGGIFIRGSRSKLIIENSTLSGNFAESYGGAICAGYESGSGCEVTLRNCTLSGNKSGWRGGAVMMLDGTDGTLVLTDCSITGNTAINSGGAVGVPPARQDIVTAENVVFSKNKAGSSFLTADYDIARHNERIRTSSFTSPFEYAYNNYDIEYYVYDQKVSTVTYETNNEGADVEAECVNQGGKFTKPKDPEREGYIFGGWFKDEEFEQEFDFALPPDEDVTLYAKWIPKSEPKPNVPSYTPPKPTSVTDDTAASQDKSALEMSQCADGESSGTAMGDGTYHDCADDDCCNSNNCPLPFDDFNHGVVSHDWFCKDVSYVFRRGIMIGTAATKFVPDEVLTRAMAAEIFWRMSGSPHADQENTFRDVPRGEWYTMAIDWAAHTGVMIGFNDNTFKPDDVISREQFAAALMRYAGLMGYEIERDEIKNLLGFTDCGIIAKWAAVGALWAYQTGYLMGISDKETNTILFAPKSAVTRAQTAALLHRFLLSIETENPQ